MTTAQNIAKAILSLDLPQIERAFAQYHPDIQEEIQNILSEEVSDLKHIEIESKLPSNGQYVFSCHDEYQYAHQFDAQLNCNGI